MVSKTSPPSAPSAPSSAAASTAVRRPPTSNSPTGSTSAPNAPPASTTEEQPRPKRRKIAKACDECRQRKSRCDGARPCGPCAKKGRNASRCTYQQDLATSISQSYIEELESRIRTLEGSGARYNGPIVAPPEGIEGFQTAPGGDPLVPPVAYPSVTVTAGEGCDGENVNGTGMPPAASMVAGSPLKRRGSEAAFTPYAGSQIHQHIRSPSNPELLQRNTINVAAQERKTPHPTDPNERVDAMGATSPTDADGDNPAGFFGSSSTSAFMKQIKSTVHKKLISSASPPDRSIFGTASSETSETLRRRHTDDFMEDLQDFILPPRSIADHLVDCYWIYVHSLYPFLHKIEFMKVYNSLWDRPSAQDANSAHPRKRPPGRLFRCILNLVFAFGCQFSSSITPSRRESSSDVFLKRARELLHFDLLDTGCIELVQALALMGQYLQSTKHPNRCWNVVGLAIRVAQGMGLHLECTSQNQPSIIEREMYRRAWHGCIILDRIISMTFGRPSMIPTHTRVPLPATIDDEYLLPDDLDPQQPANIPSQMCFFTYTLKLYEILGDILSAFYSCPSLRSAPFSDRARAEEDYQSVLRLDRCLLDFQFELPDFLRFRYVNPETGEEIPRDPVLLRQANVLHSRYLNIRILLFRPVLIHLIQESQSGGPGNGYLPPPSVDGKSKPQTPITLLEASLAIKCSVSCVAAAQEAISLIDDNLISGAVPAWWYYIFYLYTSASVLLAAKLCPALEGELDYTSMEASWKRCIEILRGLEDHYDAARRCLATLEAIHEQMMHQHSAPPMASHQPHPQPGPHQHQQGQANGHHDTKGQGDGPSGGPGGVGEGEGMMPPPPQTMGSGGEGAGVEVDPLLTYNVPEMQAVWGSGEINFDWFFEHPMWNSPDFGN